jgi:hypothetical protein
VKRKKRRYKEEWLRLGMARGLALAGVVLGRTHDLVDGKLVQRRGRNERTASKER